MPWNNVADSYQIRDDVSWTKGRHQFKIGWRLAALQEDPGLVQEHPGQLHVQWFVHRERLRGLPPWLRTTTIPKTP